MDSTSARIVAAAGRLVDCRAEVKRAREQWKMAAIAAHSAHGFASFEDMESPEAGGTFSPQSTTERCWQRLVEDQGGVMHRMSVEDYCDACKAMAAKRIELGRVGREHGKALRELAYAVRAQRKFAELDGE